MTTDREKKLVHICYQLVLVSLDSDYMRRVDQETRAKWVTEQLRGCGFDISDPCGASWGELK